MAKEAQTVTNDTPLTVGNFAELMSQLIEVIKKPSYHEQKLIDKDKELLKAKAERGVQLAKRHEAMQKQKESSCLHASYNPASGATKHSWVGQVNADGYWRPTCQQCSMQPGKIKATAHQIANGLNLHEIPQLNLTHLKQMIELSAKEDEKTKAA